MTGGNCSDCWYWCSCFQVPCVRASLGRAPPCLAPPAPEYGTPPRWSCSPRQGPAPARPRLAPRPTTAAPWSRQPRLSRPCWRTAVFTFLRPSPGGKLARIIVYKITIHNCLILAWVGCSASAPLCLGHKWGNTLHEKTPEWSKMPNSRSIFNTLALNHRVYQCYNWSIHA